VPNLRGVFGLRASREGFLRFYHPDTDLCSATRFAAQKLVFAARSVRFSFLCLQLMSVRRSSATSHSSVRFSFLCLQLMSVRRSQLVFSPASRAPNPFFFTLEQGAGLLVARARGPVLTAC
jgi:hypothetical protein